MPSLETIRQCLVYVAPPTFALSPHSLYTPSSSLSPSSHEPFYILPEYINQSSAAAFINMEIKPSASQLANLAPRPDSPTLPPHSLVHLQIFIRMADQPQQQPNAPSSTDVNLDDGSV